MKKVFIGLGLFLAVGTIFFVSGLPQVNAASINITSPKLAGGDIWEIGKTYPISWEPGSLVLGGTLFIELYKGPAFNQVLFTGIANTATGTSWTIPQVAAGSDYRVRIISNRSDGTIEMSAYSQLFSIAAAPKPSITVILPNGGEKWEIGKSYQIKWMSSNFPDSGKVQIALRKDQRGCNIVSGNGCLEEVIASSVPNTGNFDWVIPKTLGMMIFPSEKLYVMIYPQGVVVGTDRSNAPFSIVNSPSLVVTSPNGGETLKEGEKTTIRWNSYTLSTEKHRLNIKLLRSDEAEKGIFISFVPHSEFLAWNIDSLTGWKLKENATSTSPFTYKIFIEAYEMTGGKQIAVDTSDKWFNIAASTPASNSITASPNPCAISSETSVCSTTISWRNSSNVTRTHIFMKNTNSSESEKLFAAGINRSSVANFIAAPPNEYVFNMYDCTNVICGDQPGFDPANKGSLLGSVTVKATIVVPKPSIIVVSPNGGEKWEIGKTYTISWKSDGLATNDTISITLYKGGSFFQTLFTGISNTATSTNWIIPQVEVDDDYRVRIISERSNGTTETSAYSQLFSIAKTVTIKPIISSINPSSGPIGTKVRIGGTNFNELHNIVQFGPVALSIAGFSEVDGGLYFIVPQSGPSSCIVGVSCTNDLVAIEPNKTYDVKVINANGKSNSVKFEVTKELLPADFITFEMAVKWGNVFGKVTDKTQANFDGSISVSSIATSTSNISPSVILLNTKKFDDHDKVTSRSNPVSWTSWIFSHWDGVKVKVSAPGDANVTIKTAQGIITKTARELYDLKEAIIQDVGNGKEIVIGETPKIKCLPNGALIKESDDHKVFVIRDCRKHWIKDIDEFNKEGHEWENIEEISSPVLEALQDFIQAKENLVRLIGHHKVFRIVNGKRIWIPTVAAFNAQGLKWNDIQDVTELEMNKFSEAILLRAKGDSKVYKIVNGKKHWIKTIKAFNRLNHKWDDVVEVDAVEVNEHETETPIE